MTKEITPSGGEWPLRFNKPMKPLSAGVCCHAFMKLQLQSCVIRCWSPGDDGAPQRYANNRNIWINLRDAFPHPYTLEDARAFLGHVLQENPPTTFAIATPSEAIGCIGLRIGHDVHCKTAELGYWLGEPFWSRGIMSEAVSEFTVRAFGMFDLQRIYAEPFEGNHGSLRVLEKAGFLCEGRLRASVLKAGRVLDSFLYARVSSPRAAPDGKVASSSEA